MTSDNTQAASDGLDLDPGLGIYFIVIGGLHSSLIAGIVVLAVPGWSIVWLIIYAAASLILVSAVGLIRGITIGRGRQPVVAPTAQPA